MENIVYDFMLFVLAILIQCSIQETQYYSSKLACGGFIGNVRIPNILSTSNAQFNYEPLEKYAFVNKDTCTITPGTMNGNLSSSLQSTTYNKNQQYGSPSKDIFTICENCTIRCSPDSIKTLMDRVKESKFPKIWIFFFTDMDGTVKAVESQYKISGLNVAYLEDRGNFDNTWQPKGYTDGSQAQCQLQSDTDTDALRSFSKTSVLFVSISFIILMVISLAWLVFYYVQRFRYAHAKDRLQRRLFNAAKKALTRIPTKPVKAGDKELDSDCPVCIDPYRAGDIVRMLPCRHVFHKTCVDPWLLEHRTCPMCKSDILKAFGYHVSMSGRRRTQFSAQIDDQHAGTHADSDHLSVDAQSTASESNAYPFPVVSEIHDPFSFTPATSPQLVQVMHATNARGFSIIPLTVHNGNGFASGSAGNFTTINASVERCPTTQSISNAQHNTGDFPATNSSRALKSANSSRRPASRGHVVNLVHVRSRSLSHGNFSQPSTSSNMIPSPVEQRPSALFRAAGRIAMPLRTVQTAGTITIEVAPNQPETRPMSKSKPSSPQPECSSRNITSVEIEPEPFPLNAPQNRMAISHEDIPCGSRAESVASILSGLPSRPMTRGQSAKTVRSIQSGMVVRPNRPPTEPMYAAFQILPPLDQRAKTAAVIASTQNTTVVPLSDVISVESL